MLKWTVGHRKTEGPKSPSGPCYSIRRALHLARRSRTPGRDKENKGHGSHRHFQCLSPRTRDSVYMCLEAIPAALRDISNQNHTHGPTTSNQHHTHGPTASNRYHTHGPTASNQYNTHGPTASNQYHTHGPTASNQYHTHGPTASKRCCSQGRRTRTAPRDYKHGDRETRRDLVSTPRRISLCDVDSKSTLISSTSLPPLGCSDVTSPSRLMQIDYSPCPMKTTKSLLALRRRLVDAFNQSSSSSVGTPHLAPPLSVDNPLYFSLRDVPCPGPVNRALSTSGKVEGTPPSCEAIPHKIRKRSLAARFPSGIEREEADDHTFSVYSGVSTQEGHRGATWSSMHVLSMNLASLSLSNASRDGSLSLPSSRITPPSPFLNSTHASSISSTNQHDLLKACVPARRDSRLKAFVPILEDAHDLTDPRFLSHLTFMEATVMPAKNSSIFHGFQKVRLSKGFRGSSSENEPAQTSSYLEFVDSGVDMTRSNDEYSVRSRRFSLRKRNSTRRVRTVTSTSEDGPPTKVQSVESDTGLSVIPFSGEMTSLDASRSCHTPANTEYCQKILRHRKSFRSSARRSRRNSLKGIGDGVFKRENTICDSIFNECGRKDLYNLNSSGDSLDRSFSLRRQGGFRRKNRGFVTGEAARSCTDVTTTCQMTKHSLLGASSPFSQQSEGGTVSIPGITNTTFTVQEFDQGSPDPGKLNQPSSRDKSFSLTLPKGIPSPPSPTCHSVELTSPTGMDAICPLATSPGPQGGMERAVALWEGANPITNVWQRNEWRMNGLKDGNMSTSPSDETWNSHTMNALRTPVLTSGHILRSSYTTTSTDQQEGRDVAESPLALVEHRSRSRRCLLFASPGSSTRHCRSSKRRGSWKKSRECCQDRGELELALYENHGLLTIQVISGKNLRRPGGKSCNAYVKVNLVPSTEERTFHRTPVHRNCTSPLFDQQFSVELLEGDVDKRVLVSVWHRDRERRRSEFLGCMSFAVKHAIKKDISGSYRLSSQTSGRPQPVAMPRHSISSTEEVISLDSDVPVRTGMEGGRACPKKPVDCKPAGAEDSTFLRHLELEPLPEEGEGPPLPLKGGRTPFTTTRRLVRNPSVGGGFGFSIAWTQPPRVERVETGLPADQAGLLPGDYVIFVEKDNVVTLPEDEILQLIRSCGNEVTLEVYRRTTPNGLVGSSTLTATGGGSGVFTAPPQPSTATCSVTTASLDLSKRRLHLPQVTFSSEVGTGVIV